MDLMGLESAFIVGGSSGSFVTRRFAINRPERTQGIVFLGSPATLNDKQGVVDIWNSTISRLVDPIDHHFVREFHESTIKQFVPQAFLVTM
jgi:rifampin ADP-ribosylating transferase